MAIDSDITRLLDLYETGRADYPTASQTREDLRWALAELQTTKAERWRAEKRLKEIEVDLDMSETEAQELEDENSALKLKLADIRTAIFALDPENA